MIFELVEQRFAATGRTPKGRRAMRAIFRATRDTVGERGLEGASLDVIASRAGLSQAALRHYFGTREELLTTFFTTATNWLQEQVSATLEQEGLTPRERLQTCVGWHLEYMESVDTLFWMEASAYWLRKRPKRKIRDAWYQWLSGHYASLIGKLHPDLRRNECRQRAFLILTLVLGAWVTHGRGSALGGSNPPAERRRLLVAAAMRVADGS